jgi:hypothetical protein
MNLETNMRRAKASQDVKDDIVKIRLHHAEKSRLVEDADLAGISLSELIRSRAANKAIFARTDLAMLRELRRIGGLLKFVHTSSGGAYGPQTAAALAELRATIRSLSIDH